MGEGPSLPVPRPRPFRLRPFALSPFRASFVSVTGSPASQRVATRWQVYTSLASLHHTIVACKSRDIQTPRTNVDGGGKLKGVIHTSSVVMCLRSSRASGPSQQCRLDRRSWARHSPRRFRSPASTWHRSAQPTTHAIAVVAWHSLWRGGTYPPWLAPNCVLAGSSPPAPPGRGAHAPALCCYCHPSLSLLRAPGGDV